MELKQLFEGVEGLSEDFHLKLETIVESQVATRVEESIAGIKADAEASVSQEKEKLAEAAKQYTEYLKSELSESVANVIAETAREWLKENEVALVAESKVEMAESILATVGDLFKQNGLKLDEAQETALTKTNAELVEARARIEEMSLQLAQLTEAKQEADKKQINESILDGLADTQKERVIKIAESFADADLEAYKERLLVVRSLVEGKEIKVEKEGVKVTESAPAEVVESKVDPLMESIYKAFQK